MIERKAFALAIQAIDKEIKRISFDANLCDVLGANYPAAVKASLRRQDLREARALLLELKEGPHVRP
jgi:hypothetical protein